MTGWLLPEVERIETHLNAGRVRVDGKLVTDPRLRRRHPRASSSPQNDRPSPWRVGTCACGASDTGGFGGTPSQCAVAVTCAGLRLGQHPVQAGLTFACAQHRDELIGSPELLDRDRAVLLKWRERERQALAGRGWNPPHPMAVGAAAHELARRAQPPSTPPRDS